MHKILFYNKFISCLSVLSQPVHGTANYRCDNTRGCIIKVWPPDDKHMVLETCRGMKETYCEIKILCIKLVNYWDKYTEMHGQQNIKKNAYSI